MIYVILNKKKYLYNGLKLNRPNFFLILKHHFLVILNKVNQNSNSKILYLKLQSHTQQLQDILY